MGKITITDFTPEETRKKYGNRSLIIIGGIKRPAKKQKEFHEAVRMIEEEMKAWDGIFNILLRQNW